MGKKELQRYSLRKSSLGAASVLLGTAVLAVGASNASADEVATTTDSATPAVEATDAVEENTSAVADSTEKKVVNVTEEGNTTVTTSEVTNTSLEAAKTAATNEGVEVKEEPAQTKETVEGWVEKIQGQLSRFLDFENGDNKAVMVNNYDWFGSVSFIDFLRDVGKYFTVNYMMSKESVKKRIETGISYTEFAYQIMQGYDFYELNDKYGVTLQIGGSDQWGNMTAGTELLRRKADKSGHVITVPLITDSTGKKFGKSEGNAVWLDATKTTPYEMYQFWLNVMDDDAVRFLKIFTFLSLEEIEEIGKEFDQARHQRLAQKVLAREVVTLVHGKEAYEQAVHITEQLFAGNLKALSARDLKVALNGVPTYEISADENLNIVELLVNAKISPSKRQAREDVQNGAIYINGERVQDLNYTLSDADKIDNEITVIRRGKKKNFVLTY